MGLHEKLKLELNPLYFIFTMRGWSWNMLKSANTGSWLLLAWNTSSLTFGILDQQLFLRNKCWNLCIIIFRVKWIISARIYIFLIGACLSKHYKDSFFETIYTIFIKCLGFYIRLKFIIIKIFIILVNYYFWDPILNFASAKKWKSERPLSKSICLVCLQVLKVH